MFFYFLTISFPVLSTVKSPAILNNKFCFCACASFSIFNLTCIVSNTCVVFTCNSFSVSIFGLFFFYFLFALYTFFDIFSFTELLKGLKYVLFFLSFSILNFFVTYPLFTYNHIGIGIYIFFFFFQEQFLILFVKTTFQKT